MLSYGLCDIIFVGFTLKYTLLHLEGPITPKQGLRSLRRGKHGIVEPLLLSSRDLLVTKETLKR